MDKKEYKVQAGETLTTPDHFLKMTAPVDLWVDEDIEQDEMTIFFSEDKNEEGLHIHYMIQMLNDNIEAHEQHWDMYADNISYDEDLDIHAAVCMGSRLERDAREEKMLILQIVSQFDLFGLNMPPYNVYNVQNKYGMLRFAVYNSYFDDYDAVQQWIDSVHINTLSAEGEEKYYQYAQTVIGERIRLAEEEQARERQEEEDNTPYADEDVPVILHGDLKVNIPKGYYYKENQADNRDLVVLNDVKYMHGNEVFDATQNLVFKQSQAIPGIVMGERRQQTIQEVEDSINTFDQNGAEFDYHIEELAPGLTLLLIDAVTNGVYDNDNYEASPALIVTPTSIYQVTAYLNGETQEEREELRQWQHEFLRKNISLVADDNLIATNETVVVKVNHPETNDGTTYQLNYDLTNAYYVRYALKNMILSTCEMHPNFEGDAEDALEKINQYNELPLNIRLLAHMDNHLTLTLPMDREADIDVDLEEELIVPLLAPLYKALDENDMRLFQLV